MHDIAVIVVNYKMEEDVRQLLTSLQKEIKASGLSVAPVLVDNTPANGLWLDIKNNHPEVKYLPQNYNWGFGRSQNIGWQSVEAKYYFVLNPDVVFPDNGRALMALYRFMEDNLMMGMVGPKLLYPDNTLQYSCYRFPNFWIPFYRRSSFGEWGKNKKKVAKYLMKDFDHEKTQPVDWVMGSAMFIRGEQLKKINGFDERFFMYFEDCDLCRRFWEEHLPVYYFHQAELLHRHTKASAKVQGFFRSMLHNPLTRIHIISWLKYMWKWRFMKV